MTRCVSRFWIAIVLAAAGAATVPAAETPPWTLGHADGRVMLRAEGGPRIEFPKTGRVIAPDEVLITGDKARLELRAGEAGLWRVGRRAVFAVDAAGGKLTAGTALVRVPDAEGRRVEGARGAVRLGKGLWMVQAVDNQGLKIVYLNGPSWAEASGGDGTPPPRIKLRPGELVFLTPGGREFGPVVTIYLEELLLTSRLVNGFPEPLAESRRLMNLAVIQRDQLKGLTGALVAGAQEDDGFEIAVPKPREAAPKK
jgi:hypothetical protein